MKKKRKLDSLVIYVANSEVLAKSELLSYFLRLSDTLDYFLASHFSYCSFSNLNLTKYGNFVVLYHS